LLNDYKDQVSYKLQSYYELKFEELIGVINGEDVNDIFKSNIEEFKMYSDDLDSEAESCLRYIFQDLRDWNTKEDVWKIEDGSMYDR